MVMLLMLVWIQVQIYRYIYGCSIFGAGLFQWESWVIFSLLLFITCFFIFLFALLVLYF